MDIPPAVPRKWHREVRGLKRVIRGTRYSAAPMGAASRRKEKIVYIGLGTVVLIIVIVLIVMMLRRR
jgi:hypothetical protein